MRLHHVLAREQKKSIVAAALAILTAHPGNAGNLNWLSSVRQVFIVMRLKSRFCGVVIGSPRRDVTIVKLVITINGVARCTPASSSSSSSSTVAL